MIFAYCKLSKNGGYEGLGTRLVVHVLITIIYVSLSPSDHEGVNAYDENTLAICPFAIANIVLLFVLPLLGIILLPVLLVVVPLYCCFRVSTAQHCMVPREPCSRGACMHGWMVRCRVASCETQWRATCRPSYRYTPGFWPNVRSIMMLVVILQIFPAISMQFDATLQLVCGATAKIESWGCCLTQVQLPHLELSLHG